MTTTAQELLSRGANGSGVTRMRPILSANSSIEDMMVGNATLQHEEWQRIDERVNEVLRARLTIADDMRSHGLITPISLGTILRVTERVNDMDVAQITFDGDTPPLKDKITYDRDSVPVPILSKDFDIGWRQLDASRTRGEPLDTASAEVAGRKVQDLLEDLITNGYGSGPTGSAIPGLLTAANRIEVDLVADWDASGGNPVADVGRMLGAAYLKKAFGPFMLYLPGNYWALAQNDYSTVKGDKTVLERIKAFAEIEDVRYLAALPDDNIVLVQMTRDVLDLSMAQEITTVQWDKNPFVTHFRVLMVGGPQIKVTKNVAGDLVSGIVHLHAIA